MTSYDGGCFCCGGHKGAFAALLPNGACIDVMLAGTYFCNGCIEKINETPILLKKMIDKFKNPQTWAVKPRSEIMEFEEIAETCPWRSDRTGHCQAVYLMVLGSYGICQKEDCAFWHWLYHRSVIQGP